MFRPRSSHLSRRALKQLSSDVRTSPEVFLSAIQKVELVHLNLYPPLCPPSQHQLQAFPWVPLHLLLSGEPEMRAAPSYLKHARTNSRSSEQSITLAARVEGRTKLRCLQQLCRTMLENPQKSASSSQFRIHVSYVKLVIPKLTSET